MSELPRSVESYEGMSIRNSFFKTALCSKPAVSQLFLISALLVFGASSYAEQTTVLYQPDSLTVGPFPTDVLTVPNAAQKTGLQINLPASENTCDPSASPSVCSNASLLNQLDGFSVNPRLMVCFSAPIDPATLQSGIHIIPAGSSTSSISINQIFYDPASNCAFAKPNQVLNQQSKYVLAVTNSVQDSTGKKVKQSDAFSACLNSGDAYCQELTAAIQNIPQQPASSNKIIAASLFTTLSATTWLEKARQYVDATELPVVLPAGVPSNFQLSDLQKITWYPAQSGLSGQDIPLSALSNVAQIAFGMYLAPNFINVSGPYAGTISVTPTNQPIGNPVPLPGLASLLQGWIPISFHVFLPPLSKRPPTGFPVAIYGHGLGDNQFGAPTYIASTLAAQGIATLAFEIPGHGYGSGSYVQVTDKLGLHYTVSTPGRGILLPGNTTIGSTDGCIAPGAVAIRDCGRQTAVDLFALVQTIRSTLGLGLAVDPHRIYFVGQSFGSIYGTLLQAVEPNVKAAVLNAGGGTAADISRLSYTAIPLSEGYLAGVNPALLNVAAGLAPPPYYDSQSYFNDNYVLRNLPPVVNNIAEAPAIQAALEAADWLGMIGDPLGYAAHLKSSPLIGVPPKSTLFQISIGDLEVPDPTNSALIRTADGASTTTLFRFDLASNVAPDLLGVMMTGVPYPILPHRFLSNPTVFDVPDEMPLTLARQQEVATFFGSDGQTIADPNTFLNGTKYQGLTLFETPTNTTLPEQLNYNPAQLPH